MTYRIIYIFDRVRMTDAEKMETAKARTEKKLPKHLMRHVKYELEADGNVCACVEVEDEREIGGKERCGSSY